jgi:hypothetical protein
VSNMAVFCSSLTSWFPGMVLMYFLNDFEMLPVAPIITGITLDLHSTYALFLLLLLLLLLLLFAIISGYTRCWAPRVPAFNSIYAGVCVRR